MSNDPQTVQFGRTDACIGGDTRYTDVLTVAYRPHTRSVVIVVTESSPSGGRDSHDGGSTFGGRTVEVKDPTPANVLEATKRLLADERFSFKRYGKPTKRFEWETGEEGVNGRSHGLSLALCRKALDEAMKEEES